MATDRQTMQRLRRKALTYYTAAALLRQEPNGSRMAKRLLTLADVAESEASAIGQRLDQQSSQELTEITELLKPMGDRS